jgi:hypothetical protein
VASRIIDIRRILVLQLGSLPDIDLAASEYANPHHRQGVVSFWDLKGLLSVAPSEKASTCMVDEEDADILTTEMAIDATMDKSKMTEKEGQGKGERRWGDSRLKQKQRRKGQF